MQLLLDGTDGRLHQIELAAGRCEEIARRMIATAIPPPAEPRVSDRTILSPGP